MGDSAGFFWEVLCILNKIKSARRNIVWVSFPLFCYLLFFCSNKLVLELRRWIYPQAFKITRLMTGDQWPRHESWGRKKEKAEEKKIYFSKRAFLGVWWFVGDFKFLVNVVLRCEWDLVKLMDHEVCSFWGVGWPNIKMLWSPSEMLVITK